MLFGWEGDFKGHAPAQEGIGAREEDVDRVEHVRALVFGCVADLLHGAGHFDTRQGIRADIHLLANTDFDDIQFGGFLTYFC